jgi:hypothetical protein
MMTHAQIYFRLAIVGIYKHTDTKKRRISGYEETTSETSLARMGFHEL